MNHRKNYSVFGKRAAVGYISLSLAFSSVFAGIAYAGPADDTSLTTPSPGPGSGPGAEVPVDNSYLQPAPLRSGCKTGRQVLPMNRWSMISAPSPPAMGTA